MNQIAEKTCELNFKVNCMLMKESTKGEGYIPANLVKKHITELCSVQTFNAMNDVHSYVEQRKQDLMVEPTAPSLSALYNLGDTNIVSEKGFVLATFTNTYKQPIYIVATAESTLEDDFQKKFINVLENANQILVCEVPINSQDCEPKVKTEMFVIAS